MRCIKEAYTEFEHKNYYEALSYAYDLTKLNGSAVKYYVNTLDEKSLYQILKRRMNGSQLLKLYISFMRQRRKQMYIQIIIICLSAH